MKKQFAALILAILPAFTFAAGPAVHLDKVDIDLTDKAAMQDGLPSPTIAWVAMVRSISAMSASPLIWVFRKR